MTLRIANEKDFDTLVSFAEQFAIESGLKEFDLRKLSGLLRVALQDDSFACVLKEHQGVPIGFLVMNVTDHPFCRYRTATEMAMWVRPEDRRRQYLKEFVSFAESWARSRNAKELTLASLPEVKDFSKQYRNLGYTLAEVAYRKAL